MLRHHLAVMAFVLAIAAIRAGEKSQGTNVELQPLGAQVKRVIDALDFVGNPLPKADRAEIDAAMKNQDKKQAVVAIQNVLDKQCLAYVRIGDGKVEVQAGRIKPELAEQGWRVYLVKVLNPTGVDKVELRADSPNAAPLYRRSTNVPDPKVGSLGDVDKRFLDVMMFNSQPLAAQLSGLEVEYRILQVYCRDAGRKPATLGFSVVKGKEPPVVGEPVPIVFESLPAVPVRLRVKDHDGTPTVGSFLFRDEQGRVYPSQSRRLAPDFFFHAQVYRGDNETILLQPGKYNVTWTRGPEYLVQSRTITVPHDTTHTETFELKRWIQPSTKGWWSGDHHIHAAGCAHYESPTEGVTPEDMMRHVLGEDLNVGCCLSWGPCWYHQKRYFEGKEHALSLPNYILRYDVEVSGFPSSHAGHICLLRLKKQDYPETKLINDWPSWDLPIFKWAKEQGAVVGFAHSGWGLDLGPSRELPTYKLPPFDGIGANEYVVDVVHDQCDFISTVDTPSVWELNIWYHTLNCGYRCRISGETDFPCIFGERVGIGRSYVHLLSKGTKESPLKYNDWVQGIKDGRCYVSDGKSHLMDFTVNGVGVGIDGSEVKIDKPGKVKIKANVAALLEAETSAATEAIRNRPLNQKPYWDIERARIEKSRKVPVEVIVNGYPVDSQEIVADGSERELTFEAPIKQSSWICLRVFPSSHTNPIFVLVDDKPIRASKRSAEWCLQAVDRCWEQKRPRIRANEQREAKAAYDHAREQYRRILKESVAD